MTKNEIIESLKAEHPILRIGDEKNGYTNLSQEEYELTIEKWANAQLEIKTKEAKAEAAKEAAEAKLAALGLTTDDLKALGLGNN
jgi:hypothetical protein